MAVEDAQRGGRTEFGGTAVQDGSDDKTFLRKPAPLAAPLPCPREQLLLDDNGDGHAWGHPTRLGSQVQCVPAVGAGATPRRVLQASGAAPPGTPQQLDRQPCVGCTCATACTVTVFAYSNATCSDANVSATFNTTGTSFQCANVTSATRSSSSKSAYGKVCQPGGTASQAPPTWSGSQVFCVAQSSQTCAAGQVCVPAPTAPATTCVDVDAASSCPAGYSGTTSSFFTSYTPGSCGSCNSCSSGSSLSCSSISTAGTASCAVADIVDTTCGTIGPSRNPVAGLGNQFIRNGTDDCSITPTNNPPQPADGRRVCCLP